jgi:hypothetical protein
VVLTVFFSAIIASLSDETVLLIGITLAAIFVLLGIPVVRRTLISTPLLHRLRRNGAAMSAPEMGVGGWEADLFNGHPDWKAWLALPKCSLSPDESRFLNQDVQAFCALLDNSLGALSPEAEQFLHDKGFFKLNLAKESGGLGFSAQAQSAIISKIAAHNRAAALRLDTSQALWQAARDVGEMKRVAQTAQSAAYHYLIDSAQQITAMAADHQAASPVMLAMMQQQAHDYAQSVFQASSFSSPTLQLREGVPEHLRSDVIFRLGALRCHPYLFKEIGALQLSNPQLAPLKFDAAFREHIRYTLSNMARSWVFGLTGGMGMLVPGGHQTLRYYQRITRFSAAFALCCDAVLILSSRQAAARLGEVFSLLYLCAATLKRFEDDNRPKADLFVLEWAMQHALYHVQQTLSELLQNLPHAGLRWLLKQLIFPIGQRLRPPSDILSEQVLASLSPR